MQPRYLNADLAKSFLQLQPFVVPVVRVHARTPDLRQAAGKGPWKVHLCILVLAALLLLSGFGVQGMAGLGRYLRSLKWTPLPVGVGFAVIAATQYRHTKRREEARASGGDGSVCLAQPWEVQAYKLLPLRHFSRAWGWINGVYLPEWSRSAVLGSYVRTFGCDMSEAEEEDLLQYSSLSTLFRRGLKPSCRPVCPSSPLTSPVDGKVLQAGPVTCGSLHQIKGVRYSMRKFLGPNIWSRPGPLVAVDEDNDPCYHSSCLTNPAANDLYQMVLYLAPGDYHRFHSPTEWSVSLRRHFPGELFSVNPNFASWIEDLFVLNERVAYVGEWQHGFFSMTAVGATNVGSVKVYFDDDLKTNRALWSRTQFQDKVFGAGPSIGGGGSGERAVQFKKGCPFGEFNLGSTIVLLFEAPKGSVLKVSPGQKVKMGESLLAVPPSKSFVATASEDDDQKHDRGVVR